MGGHGSLVQTFCHKQDVPCGETCGKLLSCGQHTCLAACHTGECVQVMKNSIVMPRVARSKAERAGCGLRCGRTMLCGHADEALCHPGRACPPRPCAAKVSRRCKCGARAKTVLCNFGACLADVGRRERDGRLPQPGGGRKEHVLCVCLPLFASISHRCISAIALTGASATKQAFVEAEAIAKQLLTMAEQFATPPPADLVSRRVILPCNEECTAFAEERARQARNLALVSSLGLEDKDIGGQIEDEGPTYSEFAIEHVSGFKGGGNTLRQLLRGSCFWLLIFNPGEIISSAAS